MNYRLMLSPFWVRAIVFACLFTVGMGVFEALQWSRGDADHLWRNFAIFAAFSLPFGALVATVTETVREDCLSALGGLEGSSRAAAIAAATRGPAPVDPPVRQAALRLVQYAQEKAGSNRRLIFIVVPILVVFQLAFAIVALTTDHPRQAIAPFLFAALTAAVVLQRWYSSRKLARRARVLVDTPEQLNA